MIDTHTHLNFQAFANDYDEIIQNAYNSGVVKMIVVGAAIDSSRRAIALAKKYNYCFAAVGIHPHHVREYLLLGEQMVRDNLTEFLTNEKVVAIGETGFDYHHYKNSPPLSSAQRLAQRRLLFLHLSLAKKYHLPLIFHCREAFTDFLPFLIQSFKRLNYHPRGVFHCFSGTSKDLNDVINLGFDVGFDGNITYQENTQLRELIRITPLNRLHLETDSPYLTPEPYRGARNEPKYLQSVAQCIAKIKHISLEEVQKVTSENAYALFPRLI